MELFSARRCADLKKTFDYYDTDHSGFLEWNNLCCALVEAGYDFSSEQISHLLLEHGKWRGEELMASFETFLNIVHFVDSGGKSGKTKFGYRLRKTVRVEGRSLTVETELTNLGTGPFSTPFYSHHFFSVGGVPIGPGYGARLPAVSTNATRAGGASLEPGVEEGWASPLGSVAVLSESGSGSGVKVTMVDEPPPDDKYKVEFSAASSSSGSRKKHSSSLSSLDSLDSESSSSSSSSSSSGSGSDATLDNAFTLLGPDGVVVSERVVGPDEFRGMFIPDAPGPPPPLCAFNLYVERGTLSPEPTFFLGPVDAGASTSWVQHLLFSSTADGSSPHSSSSSSSSSSSISDSLSSPPAAAAEEVTDSSSSSSSSSSWAIPSLFLLCLALVAVAVLRGKIGGASSLRAARKRREYVTIADESKASECELSRNQIQQNASSV